ncbi:DUF4349 domain-containing protein [Flavobacterium agricola]|uniref:DUF4349 domain-containing protein n=1 Tax=Flavobacterium agricola TaxID=2870839 RepID=A0ABY6LZP0_9FLAO|nr:DUF4349 domain-containing protein [Flavobacterium agricola]UYW01032.1 DUF4349 domain-containing protein [Flavobacterium agricola]
MNKIAFLFLAILAMACKNGETHFADEDVVLVSMENTEIPDIDEVRFTEPEVVKNESKVESSQNLVNKQIIESDIYINTKNLTAAQKQIETLIKQAKAEVSEESTSNKSLQLTLYVPRSTYSAFMDAFSDANFDGIERKSTRITNITKEYYELKNQLNSDDILLTKYQELLKKSTAIDETLTIYERIENLERQQRNHNNNMAYYNKMQAYNLVTINVYKTYEGNFQPVSFGKKISNSFVWGWELIQAAFFGIISIWPLLLIGFLTYYGIKKIRSKKKKS